MNKTHKTLLLFLFFALQLNTTNAQTKQDSTLENKMKWFADAKLGIFIHWGIYAVDGVSESWSFYNGYMNHDDYMKQLSGFTAKNYNPQQWADLIKESGARYAVLTAKHHDGVALWNSKMGGINVIKNTPAKKDLVQPYMDAIRKNGLKAGLYFSLIDWSYPDYDCFTRNEKRYTNDSVRWGKFLNYYQGQLKEIATQFNPDLYWFDGDWEHNASEWQAEKVRALLLEKNPNAIINSRLAGHGDYATPEQGVPIFKPKDTYWELCLTTNDSWGYQPHDNAYKSSNMILNILVDCISKGGNLLLDIGPKPDGTIDEKQVKILKDLGRWTKKHSEAIYETQAGIPLEYSNYPTALSADSTILYVYVNGKPGGTIYLKGIQNKIQRARIVGNGTIVSTAVFGKNYWSDVPGILSVEIPSDLCDSEITVVGLLMDGKIKLYK